MLARAQKFCDYQDRYQQEVRDKLYAWGAKPDDIEQIICQLVEQDYINEERFARAFARGKFRIKHWGKNKIRQELKLRKISEYCIKQGLLEIDEDDYLETLQHTIAKKCRELNIVEAWHAAPLQQRKTTAPPHKTITPLQQRKIATYAISRGFEADLVWGIVTGKE